MPGRARGDGGKRERRPPKSLSGLGWPRLINIGSPWRRRCGGRFLLLLLLLVGVLVVLVLVSFSL